MKLSKLLRPGSRRRKKQPGKSSGSEAPSPLRAWDAGAGRAQQKSAVGHGRAVAAAIGELVSWYRMQLAPLVLLVLGVLAGAAVSLQGPGRAFVMSVLAVAVTAWRLRRSLHVRRVQLEAGVCAVGGTAWLFVASVLGFAAVDWIGLLGWLGAAVAWWYRHRSHNAGAASGIDRELRSAWNTNLRDRHRQLAGIEMLNPAPFEHGVSYTLALQQGMHTFEMIQSLLPVIGSGLSRKLDRLVLEEHPGYPDDPNKLRLQVITKSPVRQTVWFDRPSIVDGRIRLGLYADGVGEASYRLYTENSMWGGYALGGTGSGKTRFMEEIALTARWRGDTAIIYLDGQDGASSPTLFKHAMWSGGPDQVEAVLSAVERGMSMRQKFNRAHELAGFTPSPDYPGVFILVDECQRVFNNQNAKRWAGVAREGRKLGVAVFAASQVAHLSDAFGGDEALRSSLLAGNGFALRTSSRISANMIPGLDLDPSKLPSLPGFGYVVAAADDTEARTAPFRARYMPDEKDRTKNPDIPVPTVEQWFGRADVEGWEPELDAMTARAFGQEFTDRHELAERRRKVLLAEIHGSGQADDVVDGGVIESRSALSPVSEASQPSKPSPGPDPRCAEAIMELPWARYGGEMKRAQMLDELPEHFRNSSTVAKALRTLCDNDELVLVGRGVYRKPQAEELAS